MYVNIIANMTVRFPTPKLQGPGAVGNEPVLDLDAQHLSLLFNIISLTWRIAIEKNKYFIHGTYGINRCTRKNQSR